MQSIWHEILIYLTPDLPGAWYRKCQLTAQNHFRKHNFRNDHIVTKITKIFYYENLELYGRMLKELRIMLEYRKAQLCGRGKYGKYWRIDSHSPMFYLPIFSLP